MVALCAETFGKCYINYVDGLLVFQGKYEFDKLPRFSLTYLLLSWGIQFHNNLYSFLRVIPDNFCEKLLQGSPWYRT